MNVSTNMYRLNYLDLIGITIDEKTPRAVTYAVAVAHGIRVNQSMFNDKRYVTDIITTINNTAGIRIPEDEEKLDKDHLVNIARFVNGDEEWDVDPLLDAIEFIRTYDNDPVSIINYGFGYQTNDNPRRCNIVLLYKCCVDIGLTLHYFTGIDELIYIINMHVMYSSALDILTTINENLVLIDNDVQVLNRSLTAMEDTHVNVDKPDTTIVEETDIVIDEVTNIEETDIVVDEVNNIEETDIVVDASIIDNIDLLQSDVLDVISVDEMSLSNPSETAITILQDPIELNRDQLELMYVGLNDVYRLQVNIVPSTNIGAISLAAILFKIDISMSIDPVREYCNLKSSNTWIPEDNGLKRWWDRDNQLLSLKSNFNPLFSSCYYAESSLRRMLDATGYDGPVITDKDELYHRMISIDGKWYNGLIDHCNQETYITLEDVSTVDNRQLLSYGLHSRRDNCVFTVSEMIETLQVQKRIVFPHSLVPLNDDQLRSLFMCLSPDSHGTLIDLLSTIRRENDDQERMITEYLATIDRELLIDSLTKLLHLGMTMRGWIEGDYPLRSEQTLVTDEDRLMINVAEKMNDFCSTSVVLSMPLIKYKKGFFYPVTDPLEGLTINDRLQIIIKNTENEAACIRLSSNYLIYSAYRYLSLLGVELQFKIDDLSLIS